MRYFIVSGEKSGDMHAANLVKSILSQDSDAEIVGWGGEAMEAAGAKILKNYRDLAFMGFWEVIKNLPTILGFLKEIKVQISDFQPDVLVFVDYAGFNLKVAKWAKTQNLKTAFYIAPKAWAWQKNRVYTIKKYIDELLVIFPFEKAFFGNFGISTTYVGNPLLDQMSGFEANPDFLKDQNLGQKPIIALLPGSRSQEVKNMLGLMQTLAETKKEFDWVVAGVSSLPEDLYAFENLKVVKDQTYDLLKNAAAAIVTSGTATLETALMEVPQVVVYKTSVFSYWIAKSVVNIPYISLVNLIGEKEIVKELIQGDYNLEKVEFELNKLLPGNNLREKQLTDYSVLKSTIGEKGASDKAAAVILKLAKK